VSEQVRRRAIGDLSSYGLGAPPDGLYERFLRTGMIPTIDGRLIEALRSRRIEVVASVEGLEGSAAVLSDGRRLEADALIAATGYRRDLDPLVGHLGLLDQDGHPVVHGARTHPQAPGLYFIGFSEPLSGNMRQLRLDSRRIARAAAR
jgi:cation diffusion facilitator CzcD-associated flavoprotein CzcO